MKKLDYSDWLAISAVLFFFGIMGLWVINDIVSVQALIIQTNCPENTYGVTNGFWKLNFIQSFHIGLYASMFSLIALLLIIIHVAFVNYHPTN